MALVIVNTPGTRGFFEWMRAALPKTYAGVRQELTQNAAPNLSGMGLVAIDPATTASTAPVSSGLADTIRDLAQTVAQVYLTKKQIDAQGQIMNIQLQRAQQGLAPLAIDPATYGLPQPSFGVSLDPGTKKILVFASIGVGLALLFGLIGGGHAARRR